MHIYGKKQFLNQRDFKLLSFMFKRWITECMCTHLGYPVSDEVAYFKSRDHRSGLGYTHIY